jgi:SAM-dependent methyltransferase
VPCAVCGGAETRRLYTKFGHDIGRCIHCGLVYASPRAPEDTVVARYSRDYFWNEYLPALGVVDGQYDLTSFDTRYAPLLALLEAAPGHRLLEIGSGAGFFLKAAERAGWTGTGIELSEDAARFARDRLNLNVRSGSVETAGAGLGMFDAAAMFDTIEHLFDPGATLKSIRDALAPRGLLLISTPNFGALSRHVLGPNWAVLSPIEHLYYFEERSLRRLIEASGFADVQFVRRHAAWIPQETMNYAHTHAPAGLRAHLAAAIGRMGGRAFARALQHAGRQDILLCLARRT